MLLTSTHMAQRSSRQVMTKLSGSGILIPVMKSTGKEDVIRCSEISHTSCLLKKPRQTAQTQIKSSLIMVFSVCYSNFWQALCHSLTALIINILFENRKRKVLEILEHLQ